MSTRRPQAEAVLRAFRCVIGELAHARAVDSTFWVGLVRLHALPRFMTMPDVASRLDDVPDIVAPDYLWGDEAKAWVSAAAQARSAAPVANVLCEWSAFDEGHISYRLSSESWVARAAGALDHASLEDLLEELPKIEWLGGRGLPFNDEPSACFVALFKPGARDGIPEHLLVLCPATAEKLGWTADGGPSIYRNARGELAARTEWWRQGVPQDHDEEQRSAEGQRVILTEAGLAEFRAAFGWPDPYLTEWRVSRSRGREPIAACGSTRLAAVCAE